MTKLKEKEVSQKIVQEQNKEKNISMTTCENTNVSVVEQENVKQKSSANDEKKHSRGRIDWQENIVNDTIDFSSLLNVPAEDLVEEFYITQIKKIMTRLQKLVVRYDMPEQELDLILSSAEYYGLGGLTVAPVYVPTSAKKLKKNNNNISLCSLIDFPFGESSFKGKISDIKESFKAGANSVAISLPSMLLTKENVKELKKQCKSFCRASKRRAGIVINASDISQEAFAQAIKAVSKIKLAFITLAFGDATIEDVKEKMAFLNESKNDKKIFVLANVDNVESVVQLFNLNAHSVLTPYADQIGLDLLKRFNLINK